MPTLQIPKFMVRDRNSRSRVRTTRRAPTDVRAHPVGDFVRVCLSGRDHKGRPCDFLPRFGSGWRVVEVLTLGPKWATLRYAPRRADTGEPLFSIRGRLRRDLWDRLPKTEVTT